KKSITYRTCDMSGVFHLRGGLASKTWIPSESGTTIAGTSDDEGTGWTDTAGLTFRLSANRNPQPSTTVMMLPVGENIALIALVPQDKKPATTKYKLSRITSDCVERSSQRLQLSRTGRIK